MGRPCAWSAALIVLGACGESLPSPSSLDGPRVIALETATPEIRPGAGVALRARWFDPSGRAPVMAWRACWEDAGVDPLRCADGAVGRVLDAVGDEVAIPSSLTAERTDGSLLIVVSVRFGMERVEAFRRIRVREVATPNTPPGIEGIALSSGGARVVVNEGGTVDVAVGSVGIEVSTASGAAEVTPEGAREVLTLSLLTTSGRFDPPRLVGEGTLRASWVEASPGDARMWVVLRDDRGGVTVRAWTVRRAR